MVSDLSFIAKERSCHVLDPDVLNCKTNLVSTDPPLSIAPHDAENCARPAATLKAGITGAVAAASGVPSISELYAVPTAFVAHRRTS